MSKFLVVLNAQSGVSTSVVAKKFNIEGDHLVFYDREEYDQLYGSGEIKKQWRDAPVACFTPGAWKTVAKETTNV